VQKCINVYVNTSTIIVYVMVKVH